MTRRTVLMLPAVIGTPESVIVDTDVGSDDLLAIAFLLSRADVHIEAITVVNGLAHVERGAANLVRLLTLAGQPDIPVYMGRLSPMQGHREFPAEWRKASDELTGVHLPDAKRKPQSKSAADFLRGRRARILALGPLTNLAEAGLLHQNLVIMGGAVHVAGNSTNPSAEWNMFIDPLAASRVFHSPAQITLIPLDATSKVPIDVEFLNVFRQRARTALGRFAVEVLQNNRSSIERGEYQAWDPLAAVALVAPDVVTTKMGAVDVLQQGQQAGRTVVASGRKANVAVALDANGDEFRRQFLAVF